MILSQATKYALLAVLFLTERNPKPVQSKVVAAELDIPPHFLAKILQDLTRRGVLVSTKGPGGGFALARSPETITLIEVAQAVEGDSFSKGCVLGLKECSDQNACPAHSQWTGIRASILSMLSEKSLAKLNEEGGALHCRPKKDAS